MKYLITNTIEIDLPEYVYCRGEKFTEIFKLYPKRELFVGPRYAGDEDMMYKFSDDEVYYQSRFGWGLFTDINTMTVKHKSSMLSWAGRKVIAMDSDSILDPDTPETGRYLRWEYDDSELCI